jgi:nucleoside-diphosphate-sugar epimerase
VSKLVYTSSPSVVFGNSPHEAADETLPYPTEYACHYPHTKALAERAVLAANGRQGLATCALRPHLIWGPRDNHLIPRLIQRARSGRLRRVGEGRNLVSMVYVENAAAAHLQAADALAADSAVAGQAYFVNEPEPVNLWQWVDQILALVDLPPVKRRISAAAAQRVGGIMEQVYGLLRLRGEPPMTRFLAAQLSISHYYSIEKARRDFGYAPQVSFPEGMQRLQRDLASRGKNL